MPDPRRLIFDVLSLRFRAVWFVGCSLLTACGHTSVGSSADAAVAADQPDARVDLGDAGGATDAATGLADGGTVFDAGAPPGPDAGTTVPDSGIPDAGHAADGGSAIAAPVEQWTWVDFGDSMCANGTPTGLAVNPTSQSDDVFIYLQGGGACWEYATCFLLKEADHFDTGYSAATFAADHEVATLPAFDRSAAKNPFRDASFVFVPYCTGDVHAGTHDTSFSGKPAHFRGAKNLDAFLRRLVPTFAHAKRVFLAGSSAGGFGAQLNYERVANAFSSAEVHVFADSAQLISPRGPLLASWLSAWKVEIPASCATCSTNFPSAVDWLATTYPNRRFALTAYTQDSELKVFFGYTGPEYQTQTETLLTEKYDAHLNTKYFLLSGSDHTMLFSEFSVVSPMTSTPPNVSLNDWVTAWHDGAPGWVSVKP